MSVPDYQSIMLPLLVFASDGKEHTFREAVESLALHFKLTDSDRKEMLPSGQSTFDNRVGWARTYLKKAGLLSSPKRSYFLITPRGYDLLKKKPQKIDGQLLRQYPEFLEFQQKQNSVTTLSNTSLKEDDKQTPAEAMATAYQKTRQDLATELIQTVKSCSPTFFEQLVVDLLVKMGYGGTRLDAGRAIGKSGDGGIDGIINEDRLGLDVIYLQAKRWENVVGRPEIQKFAGALMGQKARKGIFITTSAYTNDAKQYAANIESKIILIDGETLAQLMIDYNVGVNTATIYEIKRIDSDYFAEG